MLVRQATLNDVQAITSLYKSHVDTWYDLNQQPVEYETLTLYERWRHGGPWYSLETCAVWLAHLLQENDAIPLVVELDGAVVGQAEVFIGKEPEPYGHHINISTLCVLKDAETEQVGEALVAYVEEMAAVTNCKRVTVANPKPPEFFEKLGYRSYMERYSVLIPAVEGHVFYKARELNDSSAQQIGGWFMPMGRFQNAREEWERMRWFIWNGIPPLVEGDWQGLTVELTGQPGILHLHQHRDNPTRVTVRLWTKNPVSSHMMMAVGDRVARMGYENMVTLVDSSARALLKDAEEISPSRWLYAKP
ncbi:MAG: GNAT family N-acetyltransferase [Anaerolineae bacterium]|nr:MAG: GNAT family N-acetyltransferase [Anaerolineae bacterium]